MARSLTAWTPARFATLAWLAVGLVLAFGMATPPAVVGDALGIRRFRTPEISGTTRIGEVFWMNEPHMYAVEIQPAVVGDVAGSVRLTLTNLNGGAVRRADVKTADFVRDGRYSFRFTPIEDSEKQPFLLEITSSPDDPAQGAALWATRGTRTENAVLKFNGVDRWGDLAFQAHAAITSELQSLLTLREPGRPPHWLGLVAIAVSWLGLGALLRMAAHLREEPAASGPVL